MNRKGNGLVLVENTANNGDGYNRIRLNKKVIRRHRIMCYTFKYLDINDLKQEVDHIDGNRLNNNIENLRIVSHHQNMMNYTKAKGYSWNKASGKWMAQIQLNGKQIHLGSFTSEDEARQSYLDAKLIYHVIV